MMRLLKSGSSVIWRIILEDDGPPYAILSHTWGDEEVTLQQWQTMSWEEARRQTGYAKIRGCCRQLSRTVSSGSE